ncbi:MAG: 2-oxoacid:acceptor oxidoreductase subunit alpha [Chloroflexi bacterium]|nr:2-oxoacid:acceptor oxidoreductase subunit alpha [Chloroflexota bacterium]
MTTTSTQANGSGGTSAPIQERDRVTVRFAGDSGDGMQLAGNRFADATAIFGNDFSTLPDFPAEIRAPAGSLAGVSSFQISFSKHQIFTPGDEPDTLVAMNPAALKSHLSALTKGGLLVVNEDAFTAGNLKKANYPSNPLADGSLEGYRIIKAPITTAAVSAADDLGLSNQNAERTKNFFALGLVYWLYDRDLQPTLDWIEDRFGRLPNIAEANRRALYAGHAYGETTEIADAHVRVPPAVLNPGEYRTITGNQALVLGLITASHLSDLELFYGSYPITPASDVLVELAALREYGVRTFQAEDEISAVGTAIGASYGGALGVTGTSGPGIALKSEAINLAIMTELPLIVLDVQRSGPSTGMPTKTEQTDLLQVMFGRNGESPLCVLAAKTPGDCFYMVLEAVRLAYKFVTPVILLSDTYLANTAEPWPVPDLAQLDQIEVPFRKLRYIDPEEFAPYKRDPDTLARMFIPPGEADLQHRIGGLEKSDISGDVAYSPENHQRMTDLRAAKIAGIANFIPELEVDGPDSGDLLVLSWGSTYGAVFTAVNDAREAGCDVAHAHLQYLNPFPRNLGDVISRYNKVLVPEANTGQLRMLVRAKFLVDAQGYNEVTGQPLSVRLLTEAIQQLAAE